MRKNYSKGEIFFGGGDVKHLSSSPPPAILILISKSWKNFLGVSIIFLGLISLGRVLVLSPKIVINLPRTNEKLHSKGEPDWFSGKQDSFVQTDRHVEILLLY